MLAIRAIQYAWATGEPLSFEGRWTQHTYCPPLFVPPPAPPAPILVGALGPKMTAMAVDVADGLLVHPFCSDRSLTELTFPMVPVSFPVVGQAIVGVARDEAELAAGAERRADPDRLLRLHAGLPPSARRARLGRPAAESCAT